MERIDLNYLKTAVSNDTQVIKQMVQLFQQQAPPLLKAAEVAQNGQDYAELREIAHQAKNMVAIVGLTQLASEMEKLEILIDTGRNAEDYPQYVSLLTATCKQALEDIENLPL